MGARPEAGASAKKTAEREQALKLFVVLARAANAIQRESHVDIARHGFSPGEFAVLDVLYHRGPLLLGEVQRKVLVSSGGITYLVDRLEQQGLVERRESASDRRARYAALTDRGTALMDEIFPEHAAAIERAVAALDPQEKAAAINLLRKLGKGTAP